MQNWSVHNYRSRKALQRKNKVFMIDLLSFPFVVVSHKKCFLLQRLTNGAALSPKSHPKRSNGGELKSEPATCARENFVFAAWVFPLLGRIHCRRHFCTFTFSKPHLSGVLFLFVKLFHRKENEWMDLWSKGSKACLTHKNKELREKEMNEEFPSSFQKDKWYHLWMLPPPWGVAKRSHAHI